MPRKGTYVDNASNRSMGRVGMSYGSAVHSSGGSSSGYSGSGGFSFPGGSYGSSSGTSSSSKTYVDNSLNRSLGRVGLEHGTAVQHRPSCGSSGGNSSSSKTYADNALNQSLGRVGLEHGTAVQHRPSSRSSGGAIPKTYVDNALNRSLDRVGLEHGTAVQHRSKDSVLPDTTHTVVKCYTDNAFNRRVGRVGKPLGSVPVLKRQTDKLETTLKSVHSRASAEPAKAAAGNVYVDNAFNRKHNRVGKPLGSVPISRKHEVYKNTEQNRQLGRVGKPWGTCPVKKMKQLQQFCEQDDESVRELPEHLQALYENQEELGKDLNNVLNYLNRREEEERWMEVTAHDSNLGNECRTSEIIMERLQGQGLEIPFSELSIQRKIGEGGFGEVFWGQYGRENEVVAVKMIKQQGLTKKKMRGFLTEAKIFCTLKHPNIVRFIGICQEPDKLAIVMEYMQLSLYDALHLEEAELDQSDQLAIMSNVCDGMSYLHDKNIAHSDLKSQNILLINVPDHRGYDSKLPVVAKISDFGLSTMKSDSSTSSSNVSAVTLVGTYRYAAPEVLRGEYLKDIDQLMMADIFSVGTLFWELVTQEIPFEDMSVLQLIEQVGRRGLVPKNPEGTQLCAELEDILNMCWSFKPCQRPVCNELNSLVTSLTAVYAAEE